MQINIKYLDTSVAVLANVSWSGYTAAPWLDLIIILSLARGRELRTDPPQSPHQNPLKHFQTLYDALMHGSENKRPGAGVVPGEYCQAQPQIQLCWAEIALIVQLDLN